MKVAILTGDELRHAFMRSAIASTPGIEVVRSYCEEKPPAPASSMIGAHFSERAEAEADFYLRAVQLARSPGNPVAVSQGGINDPEILAELVELAPDVVVAYGCGMIRAPLLRQFEGRILNVHLGLSPYYRGTGTNFWPLVEGCPEYVGATFMHMDEGVDTGAVIHQIRAEIRPHDTQHQIGNRLIRDVSLVYPAIIRAFKTLAPMPQIPRSAGDRLCRRKDLTAEAVEQAQRNFADGMIGKYLADKEERDSRVPIVQHPAIPALRDLQGWGT